MAPWDEKNPPLLLLTPEEFQQLPDGTRLECINGNFVVKGKDSIDQDVRFGHLAYGIRDIYAQPKDVQIAIQTIILKS